MGLDQHTQQSNTQQSNTQQSNTQQSNHAQSDRHDSRPRGNGNGNRAPQPQSSKLLEQVLIGLSYPFIAVLDDARLDVTEWPRVAAWAARIEALPVCRDAPFP
jgi:hypothetical protein